MRENALRFGADVNEPVEWPITLRVHYIRDGVLSSVDVEVDEQLSVDAKAKDEVNLRQLQVSE